MEIHIDSKSWKKIINYSEAAYDLHRAEIGGMAVCIKKDDDWWIEDPVILKQVISGGNTVLQKDELAKYYTKIASSKKYKNAEYRFLWWHSHHTMAAFWSSTDLEAIEEFNEGDFSFALVVNLKEEYKLRVSVWEPIEVHKDVELLIENNEKEVPKSIIKEVNDKCSTQTSSYTSKINSYKNGNQSNLFNINNYKAIDSINENTIENATFERYYKQTWDMLDQLMGELMGGEVDYNEVNKQIRVCNMQLKTAEAGFEIKDFKEDDTTIHYKEPADFIDVNQKFEDIESVLITELSWKSGWYQ
tara:strand:- start:985 stop:1890 length:906 start_codon:yes stop_codon:yes gene_type:complete